MQWHTSSQLVLVNWTVLNPFSLPYLLQIETLDAFTYITLTYVLELQQSKISTNKGTYSLLNIRNQHAHTLIEKIGPWAVKANKKKSSFPDRGLCIYSFSYQIRNHWIFSCSTQLYFSIPSATFSQDKIVRLNFSSWTVNLTVRFKPQLTNFQEKCDLTAIRFVAL